MSEKQIDPNLTKLNDIQAEAVALMLPFADKDHQVSLSLSGDPEAETRWNICLPVPVYSSAENINLTPNTVFSPKPSEVHGTVTYPILQTSSPDRCLLSKAEYSQDFEPLVTAADSLCSRVFSINSIGDVCRICHVGEETGEELVSPCLCSGTVGLLHLSCLERWLGTSNTTRCDLCKFQFMIKKMPRPITEFLNDPPSKRHRQNLICDAVCFVILTPVTILGTYVCSAAAALYSHQPNSWQLQGMCALIVCMLLVYIAWLSVALRHHYLICLRWHKESHLVKIIYISPVLSRRTLKTPTMTNYKSRIYATRESCSNFSANRSVNNGSIMGSNLSIQQGGLTTPHSSVSTFRSSENASQCRNSSNNSSADRSICSQHSCTSPLRHYSQNGYMASRRSPTRVSFETFPNCVTFTSSARASGNEASNRQNQNQLSQPTLLAFPFLRPILKYSNHLQASSWQSLSDIENALATDKRAVMELEPPPNNVRIPWRHNFTIRRNTVGASIFKAPLPLPRFLFLSTTEIRETRV